MEQIPAVIFDWKWERYDFFPRELFNEKKTEAQREFHHSFSHFQALDVVTRMICGNFSGRATFSVETGGKVDKRWGSKEERRVEITAKLASSFFILNWYLL